MGAVARAQGPGEGHRRPADVVPITRTRRATGPGSYPDEDRPATRADVFGGLNLEGDRFFAVSDARAFRWAIDAPGGMTLPWRLFYLCASTADAHGVAEFRTGEIAELLGVNRQALTKATKQARDLELIGTGSGSTRLVMAGGVTDRKKASRPIGRTRALPS